MPTESNASEETPVPFSPGFHPKDPQETPDDHSTPTTYGWKGHFPVHDPPQR